jgi:aryl-alcohol dehydrogenase-like predicted oxidoreductase
MLKISSYASQEQTRPQKQALSRPFESRRKLLYEGGPYVSPIGFGAYRIGLTQSLGYPECMEALEQALLKGANLIDTSSNYGFGQSELLIGKVLRKLMEGPEKPLKREQLVLVSKVGYIQGPNIELVESYEHADKGFEEVVKFTQELYYCIHPSFIFDQIERSCARLGVETLDVYLLHNPEYLLKFFEIKGLSKEEARETFLKRISQSFEALEALVAQGKIKAYGVSSNNFSIPSDEYCYVSCVDLLACAQAINPKHHFKVIQTPLNWVETASCFLELEDTKESLLTYAQKNGLGVLINRPFNAMLNDSLIRLTRPQAHYLTNQDETLRQGLENWSNLSRDLEVLAKDVLNEVPGYEDATLSEMVLSTLCWLPGVTSVLCGMRRVSYVEDAQRTLLKPALLKAKNYLYDIFDKMEFHPAHEDSEA